MRQVKISIRYKFLMLISALLVLCVVAYLSLATHVFTKDKKQLVFDYNKSFVSNLSSELEKLLVSSSSKMRLAAMLYFENKKSKLLEQLFQDENEIAHFAISENFKDFQAEIFWNKNFFKTYGFDKETFQTAMMQSGEFPWTKIKEKGSYVWRPNSFKDIPVLFFSKVVFIEGEQSQVLKNLVVTSLVRLDKLSKGLFENPLVQIDIFNKDFESLFSKSKREDAMVELLPQLKKQSSNASIQAGVFELKAFADDYLAAYSKSYEDNVLVFSTVSSQQAFSVVESFLFRSILFASIVLTIAFMVAILFSRTLTRPLDVLVGAMKEVAGGDLSIKIRLKTKDETRLLAESFNRMISDLNRSQQKLVEINRDLENKVKERTRKLEEQNMAVKDAQEALLKTSRLAAAGEIAGRAAHEVLNPLTSILTRSQFLLDRIQLKRKQELLAWDDIHNAWVSDLQQGENHLIESWKKPSGIDASKTLLQEDIENLSSIKESISSEMTAVTKDAEFLLEEGHRINKIVQSMRSLNRSSSDKKAYLVDQLVKDSINIMADAADKQNVTMEFSAAEQSLKVMVDRDELLQSITNLIRNSLQSFEEVGAREDRLWIRFEIHSMADAEIVIDIKDNATGIDFENQDKLFESNFSTKNSESGTGLGLSISRRFIRAFHGDLVLVHSEKNKGSHFQIRLPLFREEDDIKESA